jgi:hypothetical protein
MEILLLFVLAIVVSILYNFGAPRFAATSIGAKFQTNFAGKTLGTALVFFLAIYVAALLMGAINERPSLPAKV